VNDRARGATQEGAIQRATLFADVDGLIDWKKEKELTDEAMLKGCQALLESVELITNRIDMVNKRLRKLEKITECLKLAE